MWVGAVAKLPLILCRHCCLCMNNSHSGKNVVLSKWCRVSKAWRASPRLLCPRSDRRLREPAHGGRVHPAALACHPGEHGPQQSQPVPPSGSGDHRGTAHRAPASVSTHTRTGASRTLMDGGADFLLLRQNQQCSKHRHSFGAHDWWID